MFDALLGMDIMGTIVVGFILLGLGAMLLFFGRWYHIVAFTLFRLVRSCYKSMRRDLRPSRIFLIRHGESQANIDRTLYVRIPDHRIELTERGHEQALDAGKKLRSMIGDESIYVYMSPYQRSRQTWENIKKVFSPSQILTERQDPRLREQEFGNIGDLQKRKDEFEAQERSGHFYYRFSCGESGADVYDRVSLFLDTLFREMDNGHHDPTRNIVIVSHGLFMRLFLMRYFRWNVEDLEKFKDFDNCEICELQKVDGWYTFNGETTPPTQTS